MKKPENPVPVNEEERLAILKAYNVLDTLPEQQFDDITKLASIICDTPIALISLLDEGRQWFKSRVGLDASYTPREISFCQYTIMGNDLFEVENSLEDERFANNPLVVGDPNIRFYAGGPLRTPNGLNIGTLCVIDTVPRTLNDKQKEALRILSNEVITNLELRRDRRLVDSEKREAIESNTLLNAFLENSPSLITMKDVNGTYIYLNTHAAKSIGHENSSTLLGKSVYDLTSKEYGDEVMKDHNHVLETGKMQVKEYIRPDGNKQKYYISYMFPLTNTKGEVYGVGTISNDVTQSRLMDEELKISNDRFQKIFDNSPVGMAIASVATRKLYNVNKSFREIYEFDPKTEIIGKTSAELKLIEQKESDRASDLIIKQGSLVNEEIQFVTQKNNDKTLLCSANVIEIAGEALVLASYLDITERKKLEKEVEQSNQRFSNLFYNSPIGITITDVSTSEFIMANNAFLNVFAYSSEEVIGKTAAALDIMSDNKVAEEIISEIREKGRVKDKEVLAYKKNGELIYCLTSIEFAEVEGRQCIVSAFQDITERKRMETKLEEAKKEAEAATVSKSLFLANMSHEIRTPLNAMLGFADLLERTSLNEQQKDYLEAIEVSGKNLLTIINDILDFSKIEAGMLSIERVPFSPQQLVHSVYTMFFTKAQRKDLKLFISIDPKVPALVNGDPTRLNQIMMNLIGNAVKFTSAGSITVDCTVLNRTNENV
ncbi:MAG TPA: PAS domain S-box protein, partial [Bacteroidia bacterium]